MTLEIVKTKKFKKRLKRIRYKKNILVELDTVLDILQFEKDIPEKYRDHELKGKLTGIRELHLGFDDLLFLEGITDIPDFLPVHKLIIHSKCLKLKIATTAPFCHYHQQTGG